MNRIAARPKTGSGLCKRVARRDDRFDIAREERGDQSLLEIK